jgi:hypothetical protein
VTLSKDERLPKRKKSRRWVLPAVAMTSATALGVVVGWLADPVWGAQVFIAVLAFFTAIAGARLR